MERFPWMRSPTPLPVGAEGHRNRMRLRLITAGPEAIADHELLEMVLFLALPRRDTKAIARTPARPLRQLRRRDRRPAQDLRAIEGLGEAGVAALKTGAGCGVPLARARSMDQPVLSNWDAADGISRTPSWRGSGSSSSGCCSWTTAIGCSPTRPRPRHREPHARLSAGSGQRALELHATALILVHNHPSGDPTPSREDIAMTPRSRAAAEALSIVLHDHVIVGNGRWLSFRKQGLL